MTTFAVLLSHAVLRHAVLRHAVLRTNHAVLSLALLGVLHVKSQAAESLGHPVDIKHCYMGEQCTTTTGKQYTTPLQTTLISLPGSALGCGTTAAYTAQLPSCLLASHCCTHHC